MQAYPSVWIRGVKRGELIARGDDWSVYALEFDPDGSGRRDEIEKRSPDRQGVQAIVAGLN